MNKKIFGKKISVILTVLLCFIAAFLIWLYISMGEQADNITAAALDMYGLL